MLHSAHKQLRFPTEVIGLLQVCRCLGCPPHEDLSTTLHAPQGGFSQYNASKENVDIQSYRHRVTAARAVLRRSPSCHELGIGGCRDNASRKLGSGVPLSSKSSLPPLPTPIKTRRSHYHLCGLCPISELSPSDRIPPIESMGVAREIH